MCELGEQGRLNIFICECSTRPLGADHRNASTHYALTLGEIDVRRSVPRATAGAEEMRAALIAVTTNTTPLLAANLLR
jgi:hypothetical protein